MNMLLNDGEREAGNAIVFMKVISTGSQAGNCYALISDSGQILLLDFGCDSKKILRGICYKISDVVGALLTHVHADHSKSYKWLLQNGMPIYTNTETSDNFEIVSGEKMKGIPKNIPIQVGEYKIIPFYLPHTTKDKETRKIVPCPNFGYLIDHEEMGKLIFATDFEYLPFRFTSLHVHHWLLECNHMDDMVDRGSAKYEHVIRGHSSLSTVRKIIELNKTTDMRNIVLCHLSQDNADPDVMIEEIQNAAGPYVNVFVAEKGMEIPMGKYPF